MIKIFIVIYCIQQQKVTLPEMKKNMVKVNLVYLLYFDAPCVSHK